MDSSDKPTGERSLPRGLGTVRLLRELGRGGKGSVHLAELTEARPYGPAGLRVAVKILHPHLLANPVDVERFRREADLGATIDHPNVARTLETLPADAKGQAALILEYVEGRTLDDLVRELGRLPEALLRHVGAEIARGLAAIHAAGAVHRDVKGSNVLITPDHHVKVMDLGIAYLSASTARLTESGVFIGTLTHVPPEQIRGDAVGPRTDLYGLGVTLFAAATGRLPFASDDAAQLLQQHLWRTPQRCDELAPMLSRSMADAIGWLLQKDPADRPADADAVVELLEGSLAAADSRPRASRRSVATRMRVSHETALVGRSGELDILLSELARAAAGHGHLVLLDGESGIGKTRLLREFASGIERDCQVEVLQGSHPPGATGGIVGALADAVIEHFGADSVDRLEGKLTQRLDAARSMVASFASLLMTRQVATGDEALSREAVHALTCQLAQALAREGPVAWIIEDLQHASPEGLAMFGSLARAALGHRILVVATWSGPLTPEVQALVGGMAEVVRMPLARLSAEGALSLIAEATGSRAVADALGEQIAEKAQGNPRFVLELVSELERSGVLRRATTGELRIATGVTRLALPSAIVELLASRLTPLSTEDRELLDIGAVEGFSFDPDLVARVVGRSRLDVLKRLADLQRRTALVVGVGRRFEFDHRSLRDMLLEQVAEPLRIEYDGLIADAFRARLMDRQPTPAETAFLAEHFLLAQRPLDGLPHVAVALRHRAAAFDHESALRIADLALGAADATDPALRCDVCLAKAAILDIRGERVLQRAAIDAAAACAARAADVPRHARALAALAFLQISLTEHDGAVGTLRTCLEEARATGARDTEATALGYLALVHARRGCAEDARIHHEACVNLWHELAEPRRAAHAARNHAAFLHRTGHPVEARAIFERHLSAARESGDLQAEASLAGGLALVVMDLGEHDLARVELERQQDLARRICDRSQEAIAAGNLASLALRTGRFVEARTGFDRCRTLGRQLGDRRSEAATLGNLGDLAWREGRLDDARQLLDDCLVACRSARLQRIEAHALLDLARVARSTGALADAAHLASESLDLFRLLAVPAGVAEAATMLGAALAESGARAEAVDRLREAATLCEAMSLSDFGCVPAAWLARLGEIGPDDVAIPESASLHARLEAHLVLSEAGGDPLHRVRAQELLRSLVAHLPPGDVAGAWAAHGRGIRGDG